MISPMEAKPLSGYRSYGNHFRLVGSLLRSPDLMYFGEKGIPFLSLSLGATTPGVGTWFLTLGLWGKLGEKLADSLKPGQTVFAEGELRWRGGEGKPHKVYLNARSLWLFPSPGAPLIEDARGQKRIQGGMNEVTLLGYVASEPRHIATPEGKKGLAFSLGVPGDGGGFFPVVVWEEIPIQGEGILRAKQPVFLRGSAHSRKYVSQKYGEIYALSVRAREVYSLAKIVPSNPEEAEPRGQGGISSRFDRTEYDLPDWEERLPF